MKKAHIISIGNELLIGDTINTNAAWIGQFMYAEGFEIERVVTLPDQPGLLKKQFTQSLKEADFTIVTGGLGPTHDDITKKVVADLFSSELITDQNVLEHIKKIFKKRDFKFSRSNADQALVPHNCSVLFNKKGTAPGLWFEENERVFVVLPGVPYEMKYLMENEVTPRLGNAFPGRSSKLIQYFHTTGVPESTLSDDVIGNLAEYLNNGLEVAYLPGLDGVKIRVSYKGDNLSEAEAQMKKFRNMILNRASDVIYGEGKECSLAAVLGDLLIQKNMTIAVAESCTGGRVADSITNIPGCSRYMAGGIVAYSNDLKMKLLDVSADDLNTHGAVSCRVALQMAKSVAEKSGSTIGVSTTGVAGPGGGTREKPVGTVWMGFWIDGDHFALKARLADDREINKQRTVMVVLETVRRHLIGITRYPYNITPVRP
jgi:nicotinamide-nucleotide amidase